MPSRIVTVVGNPRPRSRTYAAADLAVQVIVGREPDHRIDLIDLGADLLDWSSPATVEKVELLASADLAIVASPTYKASFTGLLKLFLDHVKAGQLRTVTVVTLMVAGDPRHAMAGEVHLKPVLAELGASCPTSSLFLLERECDDPDAFRDWLAIARPQLGDVS